MPAGSSRIWPGGRGADCCAQPAHGHARRRSAAGYTLSWPSAQRIRTSWIVRPADFERRLECSVIVASPPRRPGLFDRSRTSPGAARPPPSGRALTSDAILSATAKKARAGTESGARDDQGRPASLAWRTAAVNGIAPRNATPSRSAMAAAPPRRRCRRARRSADTRNRSCSRRRRESARSGSGTSRPLSARR